MKWKTKSHIKVIMILCIALLMFDCQNDENLPDEPQNKIETVTSDEAKNFLMHSRNNFSVKSVNKELENLEFNKISQEKINGSDQLLTVIPFATNGNHENNRILLLKIDNEIKSVVFSMYADENSDKGNFSGKLFSYSLDGTFINGFRAKDGIIIGQFFENSIALKNNIENEKTSTLTRKSPIQLNEVVVKGKPSKTVDALDVFGGSGMFNDFDSGSTYYSWDAGGGYAGITTPTSMEIIDGLTGKAKCLNSLLNQNGNLFVQKLLANFSGKSEFDIKISSVDKVMVKDAQGNLIELNGETTYTSKINPSLINISISTSRSNDQSALDATRTILHEYIHADIIRKLYTRNNIPEALAFNKVYEKYGNQHGTMAALYLSSMKEALKEFHKNVLTEDYIKYTNYYDEAPSDAFYEALAWGGLKESNVKAWEDLPVDKKAEIDKLANRAILLSKAAPCSN